MMYDNKIKDFAQAQEKRLEGLHCRDTADSDKEEERSRDHFERDYARILYSSSFRRLQGKMQLLGVEATLFNRNRLTHSLEVAQIARSIARVLKLEHPIVSESCSLAHDIGNPPFGHYGEEILNELSKDYGGFEGNAQTFRILRTLEKKHRNYSGLNLTLRTLFGVTKYFTKRESGDKPLTKFLYDDDYDFLKEKLDGKQVTVQKSIDAQIMDLADEIAYAAHDLEDALSFGVVSLDEMVFEFKISEDYKSAFDSFSDIVKKVREEAMECKRLNTSEEYSVVLRKELTSTIVNKLCCDIGVVEKNGGELGYKEHGKLAEGLKKLLFKAILRKRDVQLYEKKGEKVIRGLYEVYTGEKYNKDKLLLPPELRNLECEQGRVVIDYISGMMDSFAIQEYQKYFGESSLDALYFRPREAQG